MNSQEQREPRPVGNEQTAWVTLLKRAHRAEQQNRELRARLSDLTNRLDAIEASITEMEDQLDTMEQRNTP